MNNKQLDGLDLQIINALQIEPRAPWTALAKVIGVDSVTLARRWERISASGLAWITALGPMESRHSLAIVEIQCEPGQALKTAKEAGLHPAIYSIDLTSGFRDIIMTLYTRSDDELAEYILTKLGQLSSVRLVRTHIVNATVKTGSQWFLRALTPGQAAKIPRFAPPRAGAAKVVPRDRMSQIVGVLETNARASNVALSEILGMSSQRVGDAIATMRQQKSLDFRVNIAQPYSIWPTISWFFIRAQSSTIQMAREALIDMPEVQFAAITTGQWNLVLALSARSGADTLRLESELERRLPGATIMDRSMVVQVYKHLGNLLDTSGRASGEFISLAIDLPRQD